MPDYKGVLTAHCGVHTVAIIPVRSIAAYRASQCNSGRLPFYFGYHMEWINIKEKLPNRYEMVLVYCPKEATKIRPCAFSNWEGADELGITHWMHLPEPPK
jgi:Protein of unknown function (DUF551)